MKKRKKTFRYGLILARGSFKKPKLSIQYVRASSPKKAEMKYYYSPSHLRTEATVIRIRKVPAGKDLIFVKKKRK